MTKVGGLTTKFYRETKGIKVSGGQQVKAGTVLTRNGDRWKPGLNVIGQMHLTARCDGEVYFTRKRAANKKISTYQYSCALCHQDHQKENSPLRPNSTLTDTQLLCVE